MEISDVRANDHHICIFRCWLCWGVIDPIGSVFNLDMFSLFLVNKELLSIVVVGYSNNKMKVMTISFL